MFIGHFAVGLGSKRLVPDVSLGTLFMACQFLDLVWPVFVLMGIEDVKVDYSATVFTPLAFVFYPYSHSLVAAVFWALMFAGFAFLRGKNLKTALVLAAVVLSHWVLDFVSHGPDLPLFSEESLKVGLSLWNSRWGTFVLESFIFGLGAYLYLRAKRVLPGKTKRLFGVLIAFLYFIYLANAFGPKPPLDATPEMIAGPALAMWLIVAWGYWMDESGLVR